MKRSRALAIGICLAISPMLAGCDDLVLMNVIAGLQEGTITTATGIIDTFFEEQFPVELSTNGEEGGDDLFVRL
ncbi:MAG: hypothetical protein IID42_04625 [Planctomycetes bacterium]|nr:hypothetical protein [Planctomycetota bacterium]